MQYNKCYIKLNKKKKKKQRKKKCKEKKYRNSYLIISIICN